MKKYAIITDTDASLPLDISEKFGIRQVPIGIHFPEEVYEAVLEIDDRQLFEQIDRLGKLPTTSAPSTGKWVDAFKSAFDKGADEVICFCVSSAVSGTYNAAVTAVEFLPGQTVTVIDTQSVAIGQGFMVLEAAKAAAAGASREEIIERAFDVQKRTMLFGALSTLKYLAMSGRVGYLAAGVAQLLSVKPILTIRDGKLDMLEKVRTQSKAWARCIELAKEALGEGEVEQMALLHVNAREAAMEFEHQLRSQIDCPQEYLLCDLTPGLSVHTGSGLVGVSFVKKG